MSVSRRLGAVLRLSSVVFVFIALVATVALATGQVGNMRLLVARAGHTATAQLDGSLVIAGGTGNRGVIKSLEFFDPVSGKSTPGPRLFEARSGHSAIALADGRVLLTGGRNGDNALLASSEIYDAAGGTLNPGASMGHARANHTSTLLADGRVLIAGGDAEGMAEIYDPATDRFANAGRLTVARSGHSTVRLGDGRVLLVGGYDAAGATAEIFDPKTNTFSAVRSGLKTARVQPALKLISDGKVQVYGGDAEITMEVYNPAGYFSSRGHLLRDSSAFRSIMYSPGQAALIAIPSAKGKHYAEDALGPEAGEFERTGHTATEVAAHSTMVVVGGFGATGAALDTITELGSCGGTVTTDLTDYYPGQTVVMSGSGWTPGEQITLNLHRDTNEPPDTVLYATADENGDWINSDYVVQQYDLNVTFVLTATGDSGCTAQTTFTDANTPPQVNFLTSGLPDGASVTVTYQRDPNGGAVEPLDPVTHCPVTTPPSSGSGSVTFVVVVSPPSFGSRNGNEPNSNFCYAYPATVTFGGNTYNLSSTSPTSPLTLPAAGGADTNVIGTYVPALSNQTITFGALANKTFGDPDFGVSATASSGLTVSFSSLTTPTCTVSGTTVHIVAAGTCTIRASQAGNASFNPAPNVDQSFTILSNQTITFGALANKTFGDPDFGVSATASSGLTVSFSSLTTPTCTVSGTTVHIVAAGTCTIRASQAGNASFNPAPNVDQSFTILSNQTITFGALANKTFGDPDFGVSATASSGLTVSFSSLTTPTCTVSGTTVHIVAAGTCTIRASQAGNASFNPAPNVDQSFNIAKASSTTTVTFESGPYVYRNSAFTATAQATGIGLSTVDVTASIVYSGDCTNVTLGGCTAKAIYAGDQNHDGSMDSKTIMITKASSTTTVAFESGPYVYRNSAFTATAQATGIGLSTVDVTASIVYSGDCTNVTLGGCTAKAIYAGDQNHDGSMDSKTIMITKASSTTTVAFESGPYVYRNSAFTATAQATGIGLSTVNVTASIVYSGDCTNVTLGGCTAKAIYAGDQNHDGSMDSKTIMITKASSTTTVAFESGPYVYRNSAFTATAQATGIGLSTVDVTASIVYSGDCTNVTLGGCTAKAIYAGDQNHDGSMDSKTIMITKASSTTTVAFESGPYVYRNSAFTATAQATGIGLSTVDVTASIVYSGDCTNVTLGGCTAKAIYAGDQNHDGSMDSKTIMITKASSTTTVAFESGPYVYRNSAFTATAQATGIGLSTVDVTASIVYSGDCTNVTLGGCTAKAIYAGDQNHDGSMDSKTIMITKASSTTTVAFESGPYVYRNSAFTATAQATGIGLSTVDVTASIVYSGDCTNVTLGGCTAKAIYAGDQNHDGSMDSKTIIIAKAPSTTTVTCPVAHLTFTALPQTPCTAVVTSVGLSQSLTVSYTNNTNAGSAGASASFLGDTNHMPSSGSGSFVIDPAPSTTAVTCPAVHVSYTGLAQTPCTAVVTGVGLSQSLTVSYTNNTNAGTAGASASFLGDTNHTPSSGSSSFVIDKVQLTVRADNINKLFGDPITLTYKITGFVNGETVATAPVNGAPNCTTTANQWTPVSPPTYPITCTLGSLTATNYTFTFVGGTLTIIPRSALVNYIGQQIFVTSGSSSTTAQVTLSASVQDPTGLGLSGAKVDFIDCSTIPCGKTLASGVPVSPVQNALFTGTANTIVTLSAGQYGSQSYQIYVRLTGNYNNDPQPVVDKTATVVVIQPPASYQTTGGGILAGQSAAGAYAGTGASFCVGLSYTSKLTNLKGQISLTIPQADGTVYVKSNSLSSMAVTGTGDSQGATIYAKSSMIEVINGTTVTIDGNVTLRMDVTEGKPGNPGSVGFTVLSSKDSSLYYSSNWQSVPPTTPPGGQNVWKTVLEDFTGTVMISD